MVNSDKNDPNNVFATAFGLAKDGTQLAWDLFVAAFITFWFMTLVDALLPDTWQDSAYVLTNVLIVAVGWFVWNFVFPRARADNRARKAAIKSPQVETAIKAALAN